MSLAEIKQAVTELPPQELTALTAFLLRLDNAAWDKQIEADATAIDFSGGVDVSGAAVGATVVVAAATIRADFGRRNWKANKPAAIRDLPAGSAVI